jgi:hypothetical protein
MAETFPQFERAEEVPTRKDTNMKQTTKSLSLPKPIADYFAAGQVKGPRLSNHHFEPGSWYRVPLGPMPEI